MRNVEFLASVIMPKLDDKQLEELYDRIWNELCDRHVLHGKCKPDNCTVIEESQRKFHATMQGISHDIYML